MVGEDSRDVQSSFSTIGHWYQCPLPSLVRAPALFLDQHGVLPSSTGIGHSRLYSLSSLVKAQLLSLREPSNLA